MLKLFKVTQTEIGYRHSNVVFTKYFLANSFETVESVVKSRYGELKKYYKYDEIEEVTEIKEIEVEEI